MRVISTAKVFTVLCLVSVFATVSVYAVEWDELLTRIEQKYSEFNENVKDVTLEQETVMDQGGREIVSDVKMIRKGEKYRTENSVSMAGMPDGMKGLKNVLIFDGRDTWTIAPFAGKTRMPGGQSAQQDAGTDWWNYLPRDGRVTGEETVSGRSCYVVEFMNPDASYNKIWVARDTLQMVKARTSLPGRGDAEIILSDFHDVYKGWEIPYTTEVYMNGQLVSTARIKRIKVNSGVSDSVFDPDNVSVQSY